MSILNDLSKDTVIFISGTPCTGKTTVASDLNDYLAHNGFHSRLIKVNDFAIENDLVLGEDPEKFYKVIDIDGLNESLNEEIELIDFPGLNSGDNNVFEKAIIDPIIKFSNGFLFVSKPSVNEDIISEIIESTIEKISNRKILDFLRISVSTSE